MPVDGAVLIEVENQLRTAVRKQVEDAAVAMLRDYLLANPLQAPGQVLTALFPDPAVLVTPDDTISAMANGVRSETITVGAQRRLTWVGP